MTRTTRSTPLILVLLAVAGVALSRPLAAQDKTPQTPGLPPDVADALVRLYNDSSTIRLEGDAEIPAGRSVAGDVALLEGSLRLDGEVDGDLAVLNGDLRLGPAARVTGNVTVVGGGVRGARSPQVGGDLSVYSERLRYARREGRIERLAPGQTESQGLSPSLRVGGVRVTVRAGTNYNRVEGLPVMFGPIVETSSANPLRLEALAVWRSENGLTLATDKLGYRVTLEQFLGGRGLLSVGASAHSLFEPMERWSLSDLEGSLATFLLHKDFRDYYERTGWSAFVQLHSADQPLSLRLSYQDEEHSFAPVGSPWTLQDNADPWRPEALVASGRLRWLEAHLDYDTRNDEEEPTNGWWVQARARFGVGGSPEVPGYVVPLPGSGDGGPSTDVPARAVDPNFSSAFLDARSYNRIGPTSELILRTVVGGSLSASPLPPQFQHAFGGEGSLPGFALFSLDCGARARVAGIQGGGDSLQAAFPAYGCDRMALFQAEVRGGLGWTLNLGGRESSPGGSRNVPVWGSGFELRPRWVAFLDAGRGWAMHDAANPYDTRVDEKTHMDVGLGLTVRRVGAYVAFPLTGDEKGVNFFIRLDHRF